VDPHYIHGSHKPARPGIRASSSSPCDGSRRHPAPPLPFSTHRAALPMVRARRPSPPVAPPLPSPTHGDLRRRKCSAGGGGGGRHCWSSSRRCRGLGNQPHAAHNGATSFLHQSCASLTCPVWTELSAAHASGAAAAIEVMGEVREREGRGPAVRWPAGDGVVATPRPRIAAGGAGSREDMRDLLMPVILCFAACAAPSSSWLPRLPQVGNQGLHLFSFVFLILRWIHRVCKLSLYLVSSNPLLLLLAYHLCAFFLPR
jgi:hypothetical protein